MYIEVSNTDPSEFAIGLEGDGYTVVNLTFSVIDDEDTEINFTLRKVDSEQEEMTEGMARKLQAERNVYGQNEQTPVAHSGGYTDTLDGTIPKYEQPRPSYTGVDFGNRFRPDTVRHDPGF